LFNTSYVFSLGGREYILRIAPPSDDGLLFYEKGMMATEPITHRLILEQTDLPVPRILAYDDSGSIIPNRFLIMEKLPGQPLSELNLSTNLLQKILVELGVMVRKLHSIKGEKFGYTGPNKVMEPRDNWADAFLEMMDRILRDLVGAGIYSAAEADEAMKIFQRHRPHLENISTPSLLHMDIWQENILVGDDNRITGIVDIDRSTWGDPELEFAILDICGLSYPYFFQGYGRDRDRGRPAIARQKMYTLYEFFKYLFIYTVRRPNKSVFRWYLSHVQRLLRELYLDN